MEYLVKLVSKDKNDFEFRCSAVNKEDVLKLTKSKIIKIGWENFDYKLKEIIKLKVVILLDFQTIY